MPLHESQSINFLGKKVSVSGKNNYYIFEPIYEKIREKKLSDSKLLSLTEVVRNMLIANKVNIVSDENFSVSTLHQLNIIHYNLSKLFSFAQLSIIVCLRSPVDHLFSHYVEGYYWNFYASLERDTFEKYTDQLLNDPHDTMYLMHFPTKYLYCLTNYYNNINLLLYEDIVNDPDHYFQQLAKYIGIEPSLLKQLFLKRKKNIKEQHSNGKFSHPITVAHVIVKKQKQFFRKQFNFIVAMNQHNQIILKLLTLLRRINKRINNYFLYKSCLRTIKLKSKTMHNYPTENLYRRLQNLLGIDDENFASRYRLNQIKLYRYKYMIEHSNKPTH